MQSVKRASKNDFVVIFFGRTLIVVNWLIKDRAMGLTQNRERWIIGISNFVVKNSVNFQCSSSKNSWLLV